VICFLNIDRIVSFLGATEYTATYIKDYLTIILGFSCFPMLSYYMEVLVKVDGFPKLATIGVCTAAVCNIVLDYIFVIKLGFGVKGAAYATGLSQMFSATLFFIHFLGKKSKLGFVKFKVDFPTIKRAFLVGIPDFITELSAGITIFMFNRTILLLIGEIGVVTYTVISYVNTLILMTMIAVSQGMQPLVSYNYGKGDKASFTYYFKLAVKTIGILSLAAYAISTIFAEPISRFFIDKEEVELLSYSVKSSRIYAPAFLILGFNIVLSGFYSAVEKPKYAMIISLGRGLIIIAASLFIMVNIFGDTGIWISTTVSEIICLVVSVTIFMKYFFKDLFLNNKLSANTKMKIIEDIED
ncbi:MAG TPA: MATE family efflux transporter, partial [Clostridiales bacterium]|nr:MATE family efflux transporter [Clostridiales bacterium]